MEQPSRPTQASSAVSSDPTLPELDHSDEGWGAEDSASGDVPPHGVISGHSSPTLGSLEKGRHQQGSTVCEGCHFSLWFATDQDVQCYCRFMHTIMWSEERPLRIRNCDGLHLPPP